MKLNKSLLLLIVAIIASSNAAETFSNFELTNSAANSQCSTTPVELKVNTCQSACGSIIKVSPVSGSTSKFTFNQFDVADTKCAATTPASNEFTCVDGKSKVAIGTTTYSVVCVPDKSNSSESDSSDSTIIGASFALAALALLSMLAL
ncbi:hypothetical protein ACTFIY_008352 [Dictyostelium cf. discoideum]